MRCITGTATLWRKGTAGRGHKELVLGMLDNLLAMLERFKVVPMLRAPI